MTRRYDDLSTESGATWIPVQEPGDDGAPPAYSVTDENASFCGLSLHPLETNDGLFVKMEPPERPGPGRYNASHRCILFHER